MLDTEKWQCTCGGRIVTNGDAVPLGDGPVFHGTLYINFCERCEVAWNYCRQSPYVIERPNVSYFASHHATDLLHFTYNNRDYCIDATGKTPADIDAEIHRIMMADGWTEGDARLVATAGCDKTIVDFIHPGDPATSR